MTTLLLCVLTVNPFFDANFSSQPIRSASVFSNPAGLGFSPGAELLFTYEFIPNTPNRYMPAFTLRNIGLGWRKQDTLNFYDFFETGDP